MTTDVRPSRIAIIVATVAALVAIAALITSITISRSGGSTGERGQQCAAVYVANKVMPSVVTIHVQDSSGSPAGTGSGEFLSKDGYVLTNNHVVSPGAAGGSVSIQLESGAEYQSQIVGRDPQTDIAVLKAKGSKFKPVTFAANPRVKVGAPVFAVGAPLGLSNTVTAGIVSGLNRTIRVPSDNGGTALLVAAIQTDAAINPGNSGGTLANCDGQLVGVPTAGATAPDSRGEPVAGSIGLGFAIPSDAARTVADELIKNGTVVHSYFGIAVAPIQVNSSTTGLYLVSVAPGGPAAQAQLRQGDVITRLDGTNARDADRIQAITLSKKPGDTVEVTYVRSGTKRTTTVTLAEQPATG
ncbi:putative serine protease PepD [Antricoccus suffuscus]|uniref:Putative serine protease PepD n=1 Tax=Antricoccus suffuscus TaxID=1629062 RepID=A0A2T1A6B1_9ACTN|nr:trypsin-like peptidase domain-containing protein [Antricoccus suffuscus]PRZ44094.1 putative serine protease PepD [Antricoccus suffuscus]